VEIVVLDNIPGEGEGSVEGIIEGQPEGVI
jgi:hypothetical protein